MIVVFKIVILQFEVAHNIILAFFLAVKQKINSLDVVLTAANKTLFESIIIFLTLFIHNTMADVRI